MYITKVKLFKSNEVMRTDFTERHDAKSHVGFSFNEPFVQSAGVFDQNGNTVLWLEKTTGLNCIARIENE